jgi:hypothetical protein
MGWLSGWTYRKSHVINPASGAGTNYQVKITVHYGSGTDSGGDVYLNGKCRTDFGDIRFTKSDGETLLDYWMEIKVDGDNAVFWVEVADDLSYTPQTIYVYYGNPSATTTSSDVDTFIRVIDGSQPVKGAWPLDEGSGTTAYDKSGNNNNGALYNGVAWTTGKFGNALSFDGLDDYVRVEHSASLVFTNNITIEVWIYPKNVSVFWNAIVLKGSSVDWNCHLQLYYSSVEWSTYTTGSNDLYSVSSLSNDVWYHIVVTYDGSTKKIYINGRLDNSASVSGYLRSSTSPLGIGAFIDGGNLSRYFKGIIDEVRIYNRALTAAEISDLYNYYGYVTTNYPGRVLVRKYVSPEPSHGSWGSEEYLAIAIKGYRVEGRDFKEAKFIPA